MVSFVVTNCVYLFEIAIIVVDSKLARSQVLLTLTGVYAQRVPRSEFTEFKRTQVLSRGDQPLPARVTSPGNSGLVLGLAVVLVEIGRAHV